ncbi:VC2046/SO_2500 family protein [Aliiglaciecola sp. CAU 1673]|uniref:VC2046/SO_2500 family protein n=1 Tax=Aliiglaciecola sp. CAU 1673 TaxID=3032595 RepID=UPI0023DC956B|nr:VC2046/SO_2500 family protein [Aliiglaciecola sp. CAU 1673]MDF2177672.1 VC2046/SO_2500 family protein [Aliiglaciecola sp. CAU 1673]
MKISEDIELGSGLNRLCQRGGGSDFSLVLAMLAQDFLSRPRFDKTSLPEASEYVQALPHAPKVPTCAMQEDWEHENQASRYAHQQDFTALRLWQCMHPSPLSQFDNKKRIPEEVIANCGWHAQQRMLKSQEVLIETDETGLFEVIEALQPKAA